MGARAWLAAFRRKRWFKYRRSYLSTRRTPRVQTRICGAFMVGAASGIVCNASDLARIGCPLTVSE